MMSRISILYLLSRYLNVFILLVVVTSIIFTIAYVEMGNLDNSSSSEDDNPMNYSRVDDDRLNALQTESTYLRLDNISGSLETYRGSKYNVLHLNIHSLPSKYTELCNMLTILTNNEIIVHFVLLCTSLTRGGVAMYIAHSFTYKERFDLCIHIEGEFESIAVEITDKLQKQNTVVAEVYRIPNTNESLSIQRYEEMVANICGNTNQVILGSDMNFDYTKVGEHKNTSDLLNVFFSQGLLPTVSRPTRITHTSATVINNVYMKCAGYRNVNSRIIVSDISDHYAILACMGESDGTGRKEPLIFNCRPIDIAQDEVEYCHT